LLTGVKTDEWAALVRHIVSDSAAKYGIPAQTQSIYQHPSIVLQVATAYAIAHDVEVVAATGNNGGSLPLYPYLYIT
jgi:hypothetical protein